MKKIAAAVAGIAVSCTLLAGTSFAASQWSRCTVVKAGPWGDLVRLQVKKCTKGDISDGKGGWMTVAAGAGTDRMLASALTALSLENSVAIYYDKAMKDSSGYVIAQAVMTTSKPQQ